MKAVLQSWMESGAATYGLFAVVVVLALVTVGVALAQAASNSRAGTEILKPRARVFGATADVEVGLQRSVARGYPTPVPGSLSDEQQRVKGARR